MGHIEDIVIRKEYRGRNLGKRLIDLLKQIANVNTCYKVILDCGEHNVGFYEKVSAPPVAYRAYRVNLKSRASRWPSTLSRRPQARTQKNDASLLKSLYPSLASPFVIGFL